VSQDESSAPGRQHREFAAADVLVEEELHGPGTEHERADHADHADTDDDEHQLAQAVAEVLVLARARETRELREQRRLHSLEQDDWNACEEEPGDERRDLRMLRWWRGRSRSRIGRS
jgi:hypothetical protein